jgi:hypothetical protein
MTPREPATQQSALAPSPTNGGQGDAVPLQGDSKEGQRPSLAAGGITGGAPSVASSTRPKTVTEVQFNGVTGFMGMPAR